MIVEPELRVADFAKAGADIISVHAEASSTIHLHRTLTQARAARACAHFCAFLAHALCARFRRRLAPARARPRSKMITHSFNICLRRPNGRSDDQNFHMAVVLRAARHSRSVTYA